MSEGMTWYRYVAHSASSFEAPDTIEYVVLDFLSRFESGSRRGRKCRTQTHQFVVVRHPRAPELHDAPPPPALEHPALHLFIRHELQCTVAHADQPSRRPAVKPAPGLVAEYHKESTCGPRISQ